MVLILMKLSMMYETPTKEKTESETSQEELEPIVHTYTGDGVFKLPEQKQDTVANVANVMSGLGFKKEPEELNEQPTIN